MGDLDFTGNTVLVVGGSSEIGNGIAHAFRERGAHVHVWGTRKSATDYEDVPGSELTGLDYSCVDVANEAVLASFSPDFVGLDVLVLCQGTVAYKRREFERAGWDHVRTVNLDSVMFCATKFESMLSASGGALIIVSSIAGLKSNRGNPAYAASKAGAISLTRTLGEAWAPQGIRVNGLAPGLVDTKLTKVTVDHPERLASVMRNIPAGRIGTPQDMAGAALFLASPLASYIVGQTILVDGGLSLS